MLLLSAVFIGLGYGTFIPSAQAIAVKVSPRNRMGLATSTFFIFADFGAGFGPFLLGFLIPVIGFSNLYILMAIVVLADVILYYFLHGRKKRECSVITRRNLKENTIISGFHIFSLKKTTNFSFVDEGE